MFALSRGSTKPRRLRREGGWIAAALMAGGAVASALGSRKQEKAARAAAEKGSSKEPWKPAQDNLKYGLTESRRLYDSRSYTPPPRRDLSHLFQTIPGMSLLKKSGLKMPSFVSQTYQRPGPETGGPTPRERPNERPRPRPVARERPREMFQIEAQPPVPYADDMMQRDSMQQWDYAQGFDRRALDDFLRQNMQINGEVGYGGRLLY